MSAMRKITPFQVLPTIPEPLGFIETLSRNLWWSWNQDARELLRRIDTRLWETAQHSPLAYLNLVPQTRLAELAEDDGFLAHLERVRLQFEKQVMAPADRLATLFGPGEVIAYFSMEFGIHASLPMFAGGLGVLAGDHLKSASDMGLPLVGVGLLYRRGYFKQYLDADGRQQEEYPEMDYTHIPMERARDAEGGDIRVSVTGPDGEMLADVWQLSVGRVPLLLLDTNLQENPPEIREITSRLYASSPPMRLSQEALLGIGGMRALAAAGWYPKVCHMNEGHSAFCAIERLAQVCVREGVDLKTALEIVPRSMVFTTHTPVAAGHDEFKPELVRPVIGPLAEKLGIDEDTVLTWGRSVPDDPESRLSMFILAMHLSQHLNGVSALHGRTARRMWAHVWPNRPESEVPIAHITNGVHLPTFLSVELARLFERYLGPDWAQGSNRPDIVDYIDDISGDELWRAHDLSRARLISNCRHRLTAQYQRRNAPPATIEEVGSFLDNDVLTIGFARRFATYKRANLLLQDPERLEAIITNPQRPVQFIFAGKAHPRDNEGKDLIQKLVRFMDKKEIRNRIVFIENYDMTLARLLVQGVDVWLNTPRRPFEACGTSGMKAALNGALNFSVLDGWWVEGYSDETGWAIGNGEDYSDAVYQDAVESQALYNILENEIIPCFYNGSSGSQADCWVKKMKASIKMAMSQFSSLRMLEDYTDSYYRPAAGRYGELIADGAEEARRIADQMERLDARWDAIFVSPPVMDGTDTLRVGDAVEVHCEVALGDLDPQEVDVELYYGRLATVEQLSSARTTVMTVQETLAEGRYRYGCSVNCETTGRFGMTVRVSPRGDERIKETPALVTWPEESPSRA
jgi:starch phosphorylase